MTTCNTSRRAQTPTRSRSRANSSTGKPALTAMPRSSSLDVTLRASARSRRRSVVTCAAPDLGRGETVLAVALRDRTRATAAPGWVVGLVRQLAHVAAVARHADRVALEVEAELKRAEHESMVYALHGRPAQQEVPNRSAETAEARAAAKRTSVGRPASSASVRAARTWRDVRRGHGPRRRPAVGASAPRLATALRAGRPRRPAAASSQERERTRAVASACAQDERMRCQDA